MITKIGCKCCGVFYSLNAYVIHMEINSPTSHKYSPYDRFRSLGKTFLVKPKEPKHDAPEPRIACVTFVNGKQYPILLEDAIKFYKKRYLKRGGSYRFMGVQIQCFSIDLTSPKLDQFAFEVWEAIVVARRAGAEL